MAADRRNALEAARGAVLAVHAAAGLAMGPSTESSRLLRAAEGLVRAAIAALASPPSVPPPAAPAAGSPPSRRRRRPRGCRGGARADGGVLRPLRAVHGQEATTAGCPAAVAVAAAAAPRAAGEACAVVLASGSSASSSLGGGAVGGGRGALVLACSAAAGGRGGGGGGGGGGEPVDESSMDVGEGLATVLSAADGVPAPAAVAGRGAGYGCSCGYGEPLPRSGRCLGCGWRHGRAMKGAIRME